MYFLVHCVYVYEVQSIVDYSVRFQIAQDVQKTSILRLNVLKGYLKDFLKMLLPERRFRV